MNIFFSIGTHSQDFTRMAMVAERFALTHPKDEVIVQMGYTNYHLKRVKEQFDFCPKDKMVKLMAWADVLVLQGGWGGICEAVDMGKRTVIIPRINGPEHIHDQGQVVRKMDELGCVIGVFVAKDDKELSENAFRINSNLFHHYVEVTFNKTEKAIEKAVHYDFKPLQRGSAKIIAETLKNWFPQKQE